ncbi:hypothetical protein Bca52824_015471, partial [Brassica carinata]
PHETQLRFRLIHFWEARNPVKKTITGLEMLLIDEQQGSVYRLNNFYGSKNKPMYRVADHFATVSFTWNSELSVLHEIPTSFDEDRFRFHSYEDFEAKRDLKGDLYDVVGHMKLVNGHTLMRPHTDEVKIDTTRHIMVHVQLHDGPVMKLYLWDQAAADFCKKFNSYDNTPTVLLVPLQTDLYVSLTVFMDYDVQPTIDYFNWYVSSSLIAKQVSADVVTKRETPTIADIFSYMKQESAKDAFFECTATIDDVVHGSAWYYIGCSGCHAKATKGSTSLVCTNTKCEKINTAGVPQYGLTEHLIILSLLFASIYVYDNSDQAVFVLLGDAGRVLTGRHASELVSSYFEANGSEGADHLVPVPEALISTIGQTHKFCVKVTQHNFSDDTRAITVTKILSLDTPPPTEASVGSNIAATSGETVQTENEVCEPFKTGGDSADEESKRTFDADPESQTPRR